MTGDKERDELAMERVEEADEVDERESDLPLFPARGIVSISCMSSYLSGKADQCWLGVLSHD